MPFSPDRFGRGDEDKACASTRHVARKFIIEPQPNVLKCPGGLLGQLLTAKCISEDLLLGNMHLSVHSLFHVFIQASHVIF